MAYSHGSLQSPAFPFRNGRLGLFANIFRKASGAGPHLFNKYINPLKQITALLLIKRSANFY